MDCDNMGKTAASFILLTIGIAMLIALFGISSRSASHLSYIFQELEVSDQVEETETVIVQDTPEVEEESESLFELEPIDWVNVRNVVFAIIGTLTCVISGFIGISNAFQSFCIAKVAFKEDVPENKEDTLLNMYTYNVTVAKYALAIELIGLGLILI